MSDFNFATPTYRPKQFSTRDYIVTILISCIPLIGFFACIKWLFLTDEPKPRKIIAGIFFVIHICIFICCVFALLNAPQTYQNSSYTPSSGYPTHA